MSATAVRLTTDLGSAIRAIGALSDLFDNSFTESKDAALDAFQAGRPAFWSTASYHNAKAGLVVDAANRHGLQKALHLFANDDHPSYAARTPYLLGTLIPLNKAARLEIERAWQRGATQQAAE